MAGDSDRPSGYLVVSFAFLSFAFQGDCPLALCLILEIVVSNMTTSLFANCFTCSDGGLFKARLTFPSDYPYMPPTMRFTSDMWHPNSTFICNCAICVAYFRGETNVFLHSFFAKSTRTARFAFLFSTLPGLTRISTKTPLSAGCRCTRSRLFWCLLSRCWRARTMRARLILTPRKSGGKHLISSRRRCRTPCVVPRKTGKLVFDQREHLMLLCSIGKVSRARDSVESELVVSLKNK